jgi:serine/threonine protein phosphatase 1
MMMRFRRNATGSIRRTYAVGDIHGRFDLFRQLMAIVERDQAALAPAVTQIVLLGDIIDRGPDSARMVKGCMRLTASTERFVVLKGNHEDMMVRALRGDLTIYRFWLAHGGRETLQSWDVDPAVSHGPPILKNLQAAAEAVGDEVLDWLDNLPLHHTHGRHLFVHAGIRPGVALRKQRPNDLMWITDEFLNSDAPHGFTVVHGHSIGEDGVVVRSNRIGIDTGAYRTGRLTALGIENGRTWALDTLPPAKIASDDEAMARTFHNHGPVQGDGSTGLRVGDA